MKIVLKKIIRQINIYRYQASTGDIRDNMEDPSESSHDPYQVNATLN